jgi:hypothetical protein
MVDSAFSRWLGLSRAADSAWRIQWLGSEDRRGIRHQTEQTPSPVTFTVTVLLPIVKQQTFLFIEMINKAGNLRRGMAGIKPARSKS